MKITKVYGVAFSPVDGTQKVVCHLAEKIARKLGAEFEEKSWTLPQEREVQLEFAEGELVVVGSPTYAGKLPNKILPDFQSKLKGNGALAVPVVTFGNRSFDNSLAELHDTLAENGFVPVAAAAVVCQHVFSSSLAVGRPNEDDMDAMNRLAEGVSMKVQYGDPATFGIKVEGDSKAPYYVPKGVDGKPAKFLKAKPQTKEDLCNGCGICAQSCPMGSISVDNPLEVTGICIKCQACVQKCPSDAKYFDDEAFLSHVKMLEDNFQKAKENYMVL